MKLLNISLLLFVVLTSCVSSTIRDTASVEDLKVAPESRQLPRQYLVQLVRADNYGNGLKIDLHMKDFDLTQVSSREEFNNEIEKLIDLYKLEKNEGKNLKQASSNFPISKDIKIALEYLKDLNMKISSDYDRQTVDTENFEKIYEVSESINMNYKNIVVPPIQLGRIFSTMFGGLTSKLGENTRTFKDQLPDSEDPQDSTFWRKPHNISQQDTYYGFGRKKLTDYSQMVFNYTKPKTGYGTHPGFKVEYNNQDYKIRLGEEARVAPFETRIISILGYNTLIFEYVKDLRVKYNRKIFLEYNSRKVIPIEIFLGKQKVLEAKYNNHFLNPFRYVSHVTLKNGKNLSVEEFKENLLLKKTKKASKYEDNFNSEFEKTVDEVHFSHVSIEKFVDNQTTVGPWSWNDEKHIRRQELRGYGLLAAWLGNFDARADNNRVILIKNDDGQYVLRHFISDVGAGLGKSNPVFNISIDDINHFRNKVLKTKNHDKDIVSYKYQTPTTNKCFEAANAQDAQWMFKYIDQLTEVQIKNALTVAGFSPEEQEIVYHKLMLRKENIRQVLQKIKTDSALSH